MRHGDGGEKTCRAGAYKICANRMKKTPAENNCKAEAVISGLS